MTRPQIIRADTIDLQNHTSPTAQDHTRQPTHPAPLGIGPAAPHQQAALHHVQEERASEEQQLRQAWNNDARADPPSDDEEDDHDGIHGDAAYHDQGAQQNGNYGRQHDDQEMADGESDDDDMMDKISSSPSIDDEDIDFEFVYALHTFVATVEGQANATKGDTMVLLDDSNSYWWLVRIVKDSSIGYLPAEHIETPTERLARLNKHRNIDLSATMLGDTAEKSKNPLKKAMRRRNTRTVQFSSQPIYVEASDYEFSSDDEDGDDSMFGNNGASAQEQQTANEVTDGQADTVEQLAVGGRREQDATADDLELNGRVDEVESRSRGGDQSRPSEESVIDKQFGPGRLRNGVVRNTDSFFRDETVETRKITLTPNILRDESLGAATNVRVSETRERGASFDSIGRSESSREDKRRKDKKPGMFSGLFKKKDKKGKGGDEFDEKQSGELSPKFSDDGFQMSPTLNSFPTAVQQTPQRAGSKGKLQKVNPKGENSPVLAQATSNEQLRPQKQPSPQPEQTAIESEQRTGITQQASMRMVQASEEDLRAAQPPSLRIKTQQQEQEEEQQEHPQQLQGEQQIRPNGSLMSGFIDTLRNPDDGQPKREKVKKAKQRVALDDFDSSPEEERGSDPFGDINEYRSDSRQRRAEAEPSDRLSESPVQVSPIGQTHSLDTEDSSQPPGLVGDTSSQEDHGSSSASSPEFEDVGTEFRRDDTPMQTGSRPYSSGGATAPAPLSIKKQSSVASMDQGHYVPPQPTRVAPTPAMDSSASAHVVQASGVRSITPTSGPGRQTSLSPFSQRYQQLPSSPPSSTSDSSATPTAVSIATPKTPPAQTKPEPQWSDAALRAYMDDTSHVRNLLLLIHDNSGVVPLGPEDSKVQAWYPDERRQLRSLERNLDSLLQGWVDKKRKAKGPRN